MKKIFTITALAAAMIAAATSCQKEEFAKQNDGQQGQGLVFYASLEDADTKTTITNEGAAGYKISWEATDCISINGIEYVAVPDGKNPTFATFNKKNAEDPDPEAPFKAYYPASIYDGTSATLPATQVYTADGSIASVLPMYAESSSTTNLKFKNLCGLMKFTLKGTEKVQYITLKDDTKALSGKFTVSENAAVLDAAAKGGVSLYCGAEGVQLDEATGKTFYVAVPAGSYDNLHIEYTTLNSAKYAKMKADATATVERNKVYPFSQTPAFKSDWFYFEAVEAGATIAMSATGTAPTVSLQYSTDGGESWNTFTAGSTSVPLAKVGDRVYFKAGTANARFASSESAYSSFTTTKNVNVGGNIMYLLNGSTPELSFSKGYAFTSLFKAAKIVSASELRLPATTLKTGGYLSMFQDCTALVNAPELPATTTANSCYLYLFQGCTALVNAPELPATKLIANCYESMFQGCTALVNAPELPATTLANSCYKSMFQGCKALANAPVLPATTLKTGSYESMFQDCTALVNAPELPATTITLRCYRSMFEGCKALVNAPELPATTLSENCYQCMFKGCTTLVNAPELPAKTLSEFCYMQMFEGCSLLSYVTLLATDVSAGACILGWLADAGIVKSSPHILYVHSSMTSNSTIIQNKGNFTVTAYTGK